MSAQRADHARQLCDGPPRAGVVGCTEVSRRATSRRRPRLAGRGTACCACHATITPSWNRAPPWATHQTRRGPGDGPGLWPFRRWLAPSSAHT
jgi:hypothetical protein